MSEIYEFSTGIRAEKTPTGGWVSRGFTGQYINATLDPIPSSVQRSIANKDFAVAEGAYTDAPAVIARVVPRNEGEQDWSVVAVVTRGEDEYFRPFSAYRYFLCLGADGIQKILSLFTRFNKIPVFSPFEPASPQSVITSSKTPETLDHQLKNWLTTQALPVILPYNPLATDKSNILQSLWQIDVIARSKSHENSISWAFNVEAVEQPNRFLVIQPASERAMELFQKTIANPSPAVQTPIADEQAIKSAIKSLIGSSQVKPEAVETIANNLDAIEPHYWNEVLNGQGATKAINQNIYSPQMVRLLTLRAIVLPETLPNFLIWLKPEVNDLKHENCQISLELQSRLKSQFPSEELNQLSQKLDMGIEVVLSRTLRGQLPKEFSQWLFLAQGSLWSQKRFLQLLRSTLQPKRDLKTTHSFQSLTPLKREISAKRGELALFLEELGQQQRGDSEKSKACYEAVAYLYYLNHQRVPLGIFKKAGFPTGERSYSAWGQTVYREITLLELINSFIQENKLWFNILLGLMLISTTALLVADFWFNRHQISDSQRQEPSLEDLPTPRNAPSRTETPSGSERINSPQPTVAVEIPPQVPLAVEIPIEIEREAIAQFDETTRVAIQQVIDAATAEFQPQDISKESIEEAINKILLPEGGMLVFSVVTGDIKEDLAILNWIQAIYRYQENKGIDSVDGRLDPIPNGIPDDRNGCELTVCALLNDVLNELKSMDPANTGA